MNRLHLALALLVAFAAWVPSTEPDNTLVQTRLISFHPNLSKRHVDGCRPSSWYVDIKDGDYFQADTALIQKIDLELGDYLAEIAKNDPEAKSLPEFTKGIDEIRSIRHTYCGQFLGATNTKNEQLVICIYSLVDDIDEFHKLNDIPWVDDGHGSNFLFYYNTKTGEKTKFHIEGGFGDPFGS